MGRPSRDNSDDTAGSACGSLSNGFSNQTNHEDIPNGGSFAWLQVAGSFFLFLNTWGMVNTFGTFQTYYEIGILSNTSASNISWIGSIQSFLLLFIGVIIGPLHDAGYFRHLLIVGTILLVFGLMMVSISTQYYQVLLAQAICVGLGAGCLYIPAVAVLPQYFTSRKGLAVGIVSAGSSLGGTIYPIIFQHAQLRLGFPWAMRILGFIALITSTFSVLVLRERRVGISSPKRLLLDLPAFKYKPYTFLCIAMFMGYTSLFIPIFYIQPFTIQFNLSSETTAFYLVPILNAASIPGRIIPNLFAPRFKPLALLTIAATISGALCLIWIAIHSLSGIIAISALYGFFSGGYIALSTVALATLKGDPAKLGTRMGMCSLISSIGSLIGPPIAGAILDLGDTTGKDTYLGVQVFAGVVMCLCGIFAWFACITDKRDSTTIVDNETGVAEKNEQAEG